MPHDSQDIPVSRKILEHLLYLQHNLQALDICLPPKCNFLPLFSNNHFPSLRSLDINRSVGDAAALFFWGEILGSKNHPRSLQIQCLDMLFRTSANGARHSEEAAPLVDLTSMFPLVYFESNGLPAVAIERLNLERLHTPTPPSALTNVSDFEGLRYLSLDSCKGSKELLSFLESHFYDLESESSQRPPLRGFRLHQMTYIESIAKTCGHPRTSMVGPKDRGLGRWA